MGLQGQLVLNDDHSSSNQTVSFPTLFTCLHPFLVDGGGGAYPVTISHYAEGAFVLAEKGAKQKTLTVVLS
jgi:hypothetical protein